MFAIENLHKSFVASGAEVRAVDGISLGVETGKLITLLGPSGCGKTTTLRCLAGLERPQSGRIVIGDRTCSIPRRGSSCRRATAASAWCSSPMRSGRT